MTSVTVTNLVIRASCHPSIGLAALNSDFLHRMSNRVTNVGIGIESYLQPLSKIQLSFRLFSGNLQTLNKVF